ncbi:MAG: hypothetical protein KJ573_15635 [Proteobacteria bacterium]|nr:hypothetical protein [Desulfobacterales bacterium]MBL6966890.1 hypothetical protein [Desulfobacteraceae bacterium]MBU0990009.1 hypothetical protein [Pseudomonadota bacterium]MBL7101213.1 hypothetical protein [Desulfobacteraceae bacterium]MBL7172067.1 hypothetical protein [Desulfobacteraceae bacterium]
MLKGFHEPSLYCKNTINIHRLQPLPAGPEEDWKTYQTRYLDRQDKKMQISLRPTGLGLTLQFRW